MIEKLALYLGYLIIILLGLLLIAFILYLCYSLYDYIIKKLLGWDNIKIRKDIFYFMKHSDEIRKYIKNKGEKK